MKTSQKGIDLIKHFEGCKLESYFDAVDVLTIGYGHTGGDVKKGQKITLEEAEALLVKDLEKFEKIVARLVKAPIEQHQFDALVSFTYNLGEGNLTKSTLLKLINANDFNRASGQFEQWVNAGGKRLAGLVARREAEQEMFLGLTKKEVPA